MRNIITISLRQIRKNGIYSVINIAGLAAAITAMLFAILYWKDEHSFDRFHTNNPHLYRITTTLKETVGSELVTVGGSGQVQGPAFKEGVPEIKSYVRIMGGDIYTTLSAGDKSISVQPFFTDKNFFESFSFPLIRGNPFTALDDLSSAVVTENTARKFFNSIDVVGKQLVMDADPSYQKLGKPLVISGVVKDPPPNSSLQFDIVFSFAFMRLSFEDENWLNAYLGTFVVLHPEADPAKVKKKFSSIFAERAAEQILESKKSYGFDPMISYGLQPMTDIHLNPLTRTTGNAEGGIINGSDPVFSWMFMGIALFIVLMAAINFINISIAGSLKRSKEVGIRKISGSNSGQIIFQFLFESAILCLIAFLFSLVFMQLLLPLFNSLSGKQIALSSISDFRLITSFCLLLLLIIALTGLYPAFVLSRFRPAEVLYNKQKLSGRNLLGRSLVVVQYSLAVFLLIATLVYYRQMSFIQTKNLGYNPNQIIRTAVSGARDYRTVIGLLKNKLAKEPSIKMVSFGNDGTNEDIIIGGQTVHAVYKQIDEHFLPTLEIPLQKGRNLSPGYGTDRNDGALVNEAFVQASGIDDPLGKQIKVNFYYDSTMRTISGIVKDFHFGTLREPIKPMVMYMKEWPDGGMWVKFEKTKQKEAMTALEKIYKEVMPGSVYQYGFLDELNAAQYFQEQRWQKVISIATFLSFIVCILGLFGLAHLSTTRRIKEIGIRKVLGASVQQITALLSGDFIKLVIISFIIAAPVAWLVMNKWLENYAYRITIGPMIFLFAGAIAVVIALIAVGYQSVKSALRNPVESLRTE